VPELRCISVCVKPKGLFPKIVSQTYSILTWLKNLHHLKQNGSSRHSTFNKLHEKLIDTHIVETFPTFCWVQSYITVFTKTHHWNLSWALWVQSTHYFLKIHFNIPLSRPASSIQVFWLKWCASFFSCMLCTPHLILLPLITVLIFGEEYKLWSS